MRGLGLAALLLFAVACDGEPEAPHTSSELPTEALSLEVALRSNGSVAQMVVSLFGDNSAIPLSGKDQLLFGPAGGPSQPLTSFESADSSAYVGQLATDAVDFELVLARSGGARVVSTFSLRAPFALSVPAAPVSRAERIPITWDKDSEPEGMQLNIFSPCLRSGITRDFTFDPGAYDVQPADLFVAEGTADCDLQAMVTRPGADARFAPELARLDRQRALSLEQVRVASFATVP